MKVRVEIDFDNKVFNDRKLEPEPELLRLLGTIKDTMQDGFLCAGKHELRCVSGAKGSIAVTDVRKENRV
jgi:hypothetical protein